MDFPNPQIRIVGQSIVKSELCNVESIASALHVCTDDIMGFLAARLHTTYNGKRLTGMFDRNEITQLLELFHS